MKVDPKIATPIKLFIAKVLHSIAPGFALGSIDPKLITRYLKGFHFIFVYITIQALVICKTSESPNMIKLWCRVMKFKVHIISQPVMLMIIANIIKMLKISADSIRIQIL